MKHVPTWFDKSAAYFKAKPEHAAQLKDKNVDEDSKKLFGDKLKDNSSPIEIPIKPDEKPTKPDEKPKPNQDEEWTLSEVESQKKSQTKWVSQPSDFLHHLRSKTSYCHTKSSRAAENYEHSLRNQVLSLSLDCGNLMAISEDDTSNNRIPKFARVDVRKHLAVIRG